MGEGKGGREKSAALPRSTKQKGRRHPISTKIPRTSHDFAVAIRKYARGCVRAAGFVLGFSPQKRKQPRVTLEMRVPDDPMPTCNFDARRRQRYPRADESRRISIFPNNRRRGDIQESVYISCFGIPVPRRRLSCQFFDAPAPNSFEKTPFRSGSKFFPANFRHLYQSACAVYIYI